MDVTKENLTNDTIDTPNTEGMYDPFEGTEKIPGHMSEYIFYSIAAHRSGDGWKGKELHLNRLIPLCIPVLNPWGNEKELTENFPENITTNDIESVCNYRRRLVVASDNPEYPVGTLLPLMDVDEDHVATAHKVPEDITCVLGSEGVETYLKEREESTTMFLHYLPMIHVDKKQRSKEQDQIVCDLAVHYQRILRRSERIKRLEEMHAPEILLWNEKRMLVEYVRQLFGDQTLPPACREDGTPLKTWDDLLESLEG